MTEPAVAIRDLSLRIAGTPVLEGVSLDIARDDYLAILGPNGAGKTMLLRVILGLVAPTSGSVRVLGETPRGARGRVGYVPQYCRFDLDFPIRVSEVVRMGTLGRGMDARASLARVDAALAEVEMSAFADRSIGALSGGQRQRVLIARALALGPELLLLDEPTASLDERMGHTVWELLDELSRQMAVVLVSHDIGAISRHVTSVACLNRRLHAHPSKQLSPEILEATYGCPVELLAHGQPHRVLDSHGREEDDA